MLVRIDGSNLPGRTCSTGEAYANIHVGVQKKKEVVELVPGDAKSASWTFEVTTKTAADGSLDVGGPFVHGPKGARFFYLSWGTVDPKKKTFTMFRRAKLMIEDIPPALLTKAAKKGTLVGALGLTDGSGLPLCARVRSITWKVIL